MITLFVKVKRAPAILVTEITAYDNMVSLNHGLLTDMIHKNVWNHIFSLIIAEKQTQGSKRRMISSNHKLPVV